MSGLVIERPLVLASGSPRRRGILAGLRLEFEVEPPEIDEAPVDGETPTDHVLRLSEAKALKVADCRSTGTVVGADTIVVLDGALLGKPAGPEDAERMLRTMRGRWHVVLTGLTVVRVSDGARAAGVERTDVLVRDLTDAQVGAYVAGGEPLDKAGSYGIQECGAAVVESVRGCFYNVVGLPVVRLCRVLEELARS